MADELYRRQDEHIPLHISESEWYSLRQKTQVINEFGKHREHLLPGHVLGLNYGIDGVKRLLKVHSQ